MDIKSVIEFLHERGCMTKSPATVLRLISEHFGEKQLEQTLAPYLQHINGCEYGVKYIAPGETQTRIAKCICGLNERLSQFPGA
jgi:hypothetical protein